MFSKQTGLTAKVVIVMLYIEVILKLIMEICKSQKSSHFVVIIASCLK